MMVSLRWLKEFVAVPDEDPTTLSDVFASLGHEVEGFEVKHAPFSGVVVGRVEHFEPHPDADRLRFCMVAVGAETVEVVCGADNFDVGAIVPVSLPGAKLAGGLVVGERSIRGIRSHGMICSEVELGLGDEGQGIMVLEPETPIGVDLSTLVPYPDVIFDLSITPNRGDAMSILGLARDLAAYYRLPLTLPDVEVEESGSPSKVTIRLDDPSGCPRYVGREVRGAAVATSPLWMRLRLRDAGVRAINTIVDITNYVMLEWGQPLHAFDLDTIADETIIVRRGRDGEQLRTLDGQEHDITPEDLLITDPSRVIAFAGVMGGEETEVGPATSRVLIEAAHFDAPTVMHTARRHAMRTEASSRFERGVDPDLPARAAKRAAQLMVDIAGGVAAPGARDEYPTKIEPWVVSFPSGEASRLLGVAMTADEAAGTLERLGFSVRAGNPMAVTVPTYRPDVTRPADLVEEIARLYGLNRIPSRLPHGPGSGLDRQARRARALREALIGVGLSEAFTSTFVASADLAALRLDPGRAIEVRNPISEEESLLRPTLLPGLLKSVRFNQRRGMRAVGLFEIGAIFLDEPDPADPSIPHQPNSLAFVIAGPFGESRFDAAARPADIATATAVWDAVAHAARVDAQIRADTITAFHPGRAARIMVDGAAIGVVGELHPAVARAFDIEDPVAAAEVRIDTLLTPKGYWVFDEPSVYPPIVFDMAFEVDEAVPASEFLEVVREAAGPNLEVARLFDEFRGRPLPEGRKSLAVQLTFRSVETTLTNDDVRLDRERITGAVAKLGGALRGGG
jgi:phenylalanyl-tRNA synthetase beta chain